MTTSTQIQRIYNFSAGPAILPLPVLKQAQRDLLALPDAGASILEISHRSKAFDAVIEQAEADLRTLLAVPNDYHVLFLQGGASLQFSMVPMNFMRGKSADFIVTGSWAKKAVKEAKREGEARIIWNGEAEKYTRVPQQTELNSTPGAAYAHVTSNETIEGIEFPYDPDFGGTPVVCDASSDILSRPIDVSKYALIYAGAQKNMGPAGATVVIVKDRFLQQAGEGLHTMLDYRLMAENKSLYNTPPVFSIYIVGLVAKWILNDVGGLEEMKKRNAEKATLIYDAIDASGGYYRGHAQTGSRSTMNITFRMPNEELEARFVQEAKASKLDGLKGHRSVGGLRASIYNAFPLEGAEALVKFMKEFQSNNG